MDALDWTIDFEQAQSPLQKIFPAMALEKALSLVAAHLTLEGFFHLLALQESCGLSLMDSIDD